MAKKRYRVTGEQPVAGHAQGEEFDHDFGEQEQALIDGGAIELAKKPAKQPADEKEG